MGLKSDDSTTHIQTILRFALALRDATGVPHPPGYTPITSTCRAAIDSIKLPSPPPLLPFFLEAGLGHEVAAAANKVYQLRSDELRRRVQESIVTTCNKIAELPVVALASSPETFIRNVVSSFTGVYLRRLEQWREEVIQRFKQGPQTTHNIVPKSSHSFNHDYVPLLEHFFEENPFPTQADKILLAKNSNMGYKQIHVWFQNRRSRTKKEGKALKKKSARGVTMKGFSTLYGYGKEVNVRCQVSNPSKASLPEGMTGDDMPKDPFCSSSPPHAFPSLYPPTCHYDPFPCKSGPIRFSKPEWRRVPDRKHLLHSSISIDGLMEKFSQLNVRDGTRSKGSPKMHSHAATAAITIIPSRAPHPSLMMHEYCQPTNAFQTRPSVRAPASCFNAFQNSDSTLTPVTLVPLSIPPGTSELTGKRKNARLPQRVSGRMRSICRDITPSESSSTSSSSPRLSSDSENHNCSLSSVGSLSSPSDTTSVLELPHSLGF